jgi:hypothetical protein
VSPFDLTNVGVGTNVTGVLVGFGVKGTITNTTDSSTSRFNGNFSTQITGTNLQAIIATINGGGTITNSYSANFAAVPEPSTLLLSCLGILMVVACRVHYNRRKSPNA